jgi:uncharacterized membrane protein (UPF0127 family)
MIKIFFIAVEANISTVTYHKPCREATQDAAQRYELTENLARGKFYKKEDSVNCRKF